MHKMEIKLTWTYNSKKSKIKLNFNVIILKGYRIAIQNGSGLSAKE